GRRLQGSLPDGTSKTGGDELAADPQKHCLPTLEKNRVYLCLEPLSAAETNFMTTAAEGVRLIRRLAHPFVKLHLDVKAMSSEGPPVPAIIRANAEFLHHFHANDPNRRGPGFGAVDFKPIFRALADVNY